MGTTSRLTRATAAVAAVALITTQLALPPRADAAAPGSSTASAGSAPPPSMTAIEAFQPDLFTGRAVTSIPIAVPPGRKGIQPSLALTYSSSARNGWVGVGWGLDLGAIERSTKNGVPAYDATDTFSLLFQGVTSDLVQIPDGTYRAETEGLFLRIESKGVSGWEVRDKSGTRYLFGQTSASQLDNAGNVFRWALDKIIDTNGNSLTITYTKDPVDLQLYPAQINYTAHDSGLQPQNQVNFIPEARPDVDVSYRSGFRIATAKRLKQIETKATVGTTLQPARRYDLTYIQSTLTKRSLLRTVRQVGSDGSTGLPATVLTYSDAGAPTYALRANNATVSVAAWNVRLANLDFGSNNHGAVDPRAGLPWGDPQIVQGSKTIGCVSIDANPDGSLAMTGCQDTYAHAWTWLYARDPITVSLNYDRTACDSNGSVWQEDASGIQRIMPNQIFQLAAGWTVLHVTDYHQDACFGSKLMMPLKSIVTTMAPSQFLTPQLAGDFDGNGITDLLSVNLSTGTWKVSTSNGDVQPPETVWLSSFGDASSIPLLGDWDGDAKTDIAVFKSGVWKFAKTNATDTGFVAGNPADFSFGNGVPITGDFNGDGRVDLGLFNSGSWSVALGNGAGFAAASGFTTTFGNSNSEPLTGDFNGDGLTDIGILDKTSGNVDIRLSTGKTFAGPVSWITNFAANQSHTTADINGDGLTDLVYYDKTAKQAKYALSTGVGFGTVAAMPPTFTKATADDALQFGDFNGDGLVDPAVFNAINGGSELAFSAGNFPDLLIGLDNGLGGTTAITYQTSTQCDNICPVERIPKLPFVIPLAIRVAVSDGMAHSYATNYLYAKGRYDAPTREFRGFGRVEVRDADANLLVTEFLQDQHTKGHPFRTQVRDAGGKLWTKTEQTWSCSEPYPNVHFVKLDQTDSFACNGDDTCAKNRARITYDAQNGNMTNAMDDGDPDVLGDERSTVTSYALNTSPTVWILNRPKLVQTLDAQGSAIAQKQFYYDGATATSTPPTKGNLTKEEEWLNLPTGRWLPTTLTYDAFGNVATVADAATPPRVTTNTYDANGTFLITINNVVGHTRQLAYDARLGQVTSSIDQNNIKTATEYDALGRVTKIIGPNDSSALPTVRYEYDPCLATAACAPPVRTSVYARVASGQALELATHSFIDGLGRAIQVRAPAEASGKQVVTGAVEFNTRGQVAKQWAPYLDTASSSYVPMALTSGLAPPDVYTYDPLGRLIQTVDANGAITTTQYDDRSVTATDANGHATRRTSDTLGRLATVEEFNDTQTYTTRYQYDALGNLKQVTDHAGNSTRIDYDSLGRKISMDDPDMGHWTYGYDDIDNLTSQTDARGVTISFAYDKLNRLTSKSYSGLGSIPNPGTVTYAYDISAPTQSYSAGKLVKISDASGVSDFVYDNLGRLTKESKTIDGVTYTIQRAYDLLGRLTALTYPDSDVANYTYNPQGGIETVALQSTASGTTPLVSSIDYNAAGQLTKIVYGNGITTDYAYHPETLRLESLRSTGPAGVLQDFGYVFDRVGNVKQITDSRYGASQTFQYDALDRLTQATGSYGSLGYRYDALGNLLEKEGDTLSYGLTGGAKPHAVTAVSRPGLPTARMVYDANGNLTEKQSPVSSLLTQTLTYDAENRLVRAASPQDQTVTVTFAPGWNFFSLPVLPSDANISALLPNFSADFAQISRYEPTSGAFSYYVGSAKFNDFATLDYGTGYQVYCKNPSGVTVTFKGKAPSQTLSKPVGVGWQLLGGIKLQVAPVAEVFSSIDASAIRRYDTATRSLTTATQVAPGQAYYVQVRTSSTWKPPLPADVSTQFVYDGDGGRVKQATASGTTRFLGQSVEIAPDGKVTKYVFAGSQRIAAIETPAGLASLPPASPQRGWAGWWPALLDALALWRTPTADAAVPPAALRFYLTDHLGSSHVITDGTGATGELAEHTPFGGLSRHDVSAPKPAHHQFTGQDQDASTGFLLFPARAYDPALGRFLQADPFVQSPADSQSYNRYSYVHNSPVVFVDPSGNFLSELWGLFGQRGDKNRSTEIFLPIGPFFVLGYDPQREEVFLGVSGELPGGGHAETGVYYNWERDQVGFKASIYTNDYSAEGRVYYDVDDSQWGGSVGLSTDYGGFFADTDGQRYLSVYGYDVPLKGDKSADAGRLVQDLGISAGLAADEILRALLAPQLSSRWEGVGWIGLGIGISFLDGPFPFADAAGYGIAAIGFEALQAALSVSAVATGFQLVQPEISFYREHRKRRPSTKERHEEAQARRRRDQGNESGDIRRHRPRKRFGGKRYQ